MKSFIVKDDIYTIAGFMGGTESVQPIVPAFEVEKRIAQ